MSVLKQDEDRISSENLNLRQLGDALFVCLFVWSAGRLDADRPAELRLQLLAADTRRGLRQDQLAVTAVDRTGPRSKRQQEDGSVDRFL